MIFVPREVRALADLEIYFILLFYFYFKLIFNIEFYYYCLLRVIHTIAQRCSLETRMLLKGSFIELT